MYNNPANQKLSRQQKQWEMRSWKYDIESYNRMKKLREIYIKSNRPTDFPDKNMQEIRDRWPNVKKWD